MRFALFVFVLLVACGSDPPAATSDVPPSDVTLPTDRSAPLCTPGRTKACPCANGMMGAQTCQADGTYSACACFDAGVPVDAPAVGDAPSADAGHDAQSDAINDGPLRSTYARCMTGDRCGMGSCLASSVQVAGMPEGSHCSALCPTGAANTCPGYVAGQVECIAVDGNVARAQCFRLCQSTNDCAPLNTTCTQIMQPAGPIRVCAPTS